MRYPRFLQPPLFLFAKVLFGWRNSLRVRGTEHLEKIRPGVPVIIVANHRNGFDPMLIAAALPWRVLRQLLPLRCLTGAEYMRLPSLVAIAYRLTGSYSNDRKGEGAHRRSVAMLQRGDTLMFFPEGVTTDPLPSPQKGKIGVLWVARETSGALLLPVRIETQLRMGAGAALRGGRGFAVTFGAPYRPESFAEDLQPQTNELMERIYSL